MSEFKRGSVVTITRQAYNIWVPRTPEEFQALRDADAKAGRWCDDAGETILYDQCGGWNSFPEEEQLEVTVTSLRPKNVRSMFWGRPPTYLIEAVARLNGVERKLYFKERKNA